MTNIKLNKFFLQSPVLKSHHLKPIYITNYLKSSHRVDILRKNFYKYFYEIQDARLILPSSLRSVYHTNANTWRLWRRVNKQ